MAGLIVANGQASGESPRRPPLVAKGSLRALTGSSQAVDGRHPLRMDPFGDGTRGCGPHLDLVRLQGPLFAPRTCPERPRRPLDRGIIVVAAAGTKEDRSMTGMSRSRKTFPWPSRSARARCPGRIARFSSMGYIGNRTDPNMKPEWSLRSDQVISTYRGPTTSPERHKSRTADQPGLWPSFSRHIPSCAPPGLPQIVLKVKLALIAICDDRAGQVIPHDPCTDTE